jgi:hypothetical protein
VIAGEGEVLDTPRAAIHKTSSFNCKSSNEREGFKYRRSFHL